MGLLPALFRRGHQARQARPGAAAGPDEHRSRSVARETRGHQFLRERTVLATKKIRVYELARELGVDNAVVVELSNELKIGVKSHSSSIDEPSADRVRRLADSRGLKRAPVVEPEPAAAPPEPEAPAAVTPPAPVAPAAGNPAAPAGTVSPAVQEPNPAAAPPAPKAVRSAPA